MTVAPKSHQNTESNNKSNSGSQSESKADLTAGSSAGPTSPKPCWIYKSPRKDEMYLYLDREDDFSQVPEALLKQFGNPVFVMQLELSAEKKLARENTMTVLQSLSEQGFHLQMPPKLTPTLYHGNED